MQTSAPAKIILLGEHAVVYGQPAIAIPLPALRAVATVQPGETGLKINALDLHRVLPVDVTDQQVENVLIYTAQMTLEKLGCPSPDATITLHSTIPMAGGLGSGAAVSAALARAVAFACEMPIDDDKLNELIFEIEKFHHGTPSGIDNTVIVYEQPVYFVREEPIQILYIERPLTLVIGDTGLSALTKLAVGDVRRLVESDPDHYKPILIAIGQIVDDASTAIANGDVDALGLLMNRNHALLQELTVSSPELDRLVEAAQAAGAMGAKLSGGGRGGNMIALVDSRTINPVKSALVQAGATQVYVSTIGGGIDPHV